MFENIDEHVNAALVNQGTPTPAASPIETTVANAEDEPNPLDEANKEIARITAERETERLEHELKLAEERLKTAQAQASKPVVHLNLGMQDAQFSQAIRDVKGNAFWHRLSIQQKADALGIGVMASTPVKELKKYFGSGSSSADAVRLSSQQPDLYKQYRLLSKIHGIIG